MLQPPLVLCSFHWLWGRKLPAAIKDVFMRLIKPDQVIPAVHDRQEILCFWIATKMDGHAAILVLTAGDIVERVGIVRVLLKIPLLVVEAD